MPVAVEHMRAEGDEFRIPRMVAKQIVDGLAVLRTRRRADLYFLAVVAPDGLYRQVANLTVFDRFTRAYVMLAIAEVFEGLFESHVNAYYVLDNEIRADRFQLLLVIFQLAGIDVVSPRQDGPEWEKLQRRIVDGLRAGRHVAYVEPDGTVNHLDRARALATSYSCVGTFRNLAPALPNFTVLASKS